MPSKTPKLRRADLPFLAVWSLRAAKVIDPSMNDVEVEVGGLKRKVGLWHMHFRHNGGSWSYFLCPHCGRKCQILRLCDGRIACRSCDGLPNERVKDIERLRQKLAKSSLHERSSLEVSLRRAIIAERRERLKGWPPKP